MNSTSVLLAELHVDLLLDQLSVSANLQIALISYQNIGKIPYRCITIYFSSHATNITDNIANNSLQNYGFRNITNYM